MEGELEPDPLLSWKERLLGKSSHVLRGKNGVSSIEKDDAFTFMEGDVVRSFVNGIPSINFSERINQNLLI